MTINIAIAVSEGLVMAADSLSSVASGPYNAIHSSVEKITDFRGKRIALMVSGIGELDKRTIISLIREFEFDAYARDAAAVETWNVSALASHVMVFLHSRYAVAFSSDDPPERGRTEGKVPEGLQVVRASTASDLAIVIGGFSPGSFFPEIVELNFRAGAAPLFTHHLPSATKPSGSNYLNYWGHTIALNRLVDGYDPYIFFLADLGADARARAKMPRLPKLRKTFVHDIGQLAPFLKMEHRLAGMPLQEAVEFAEYLGTVAIGYDRFSCTPPRIGGELDVVAIQADGLNWYRRKAFLRDMESAREAARIHAEREQFRRALKSLGNAPARAPNQDKDPPPDDK